MKLYLEGKCVMEGRPVLEPLTGLGIDEARLDERDVDFLVALMEQPLGRQQVRDWFSNALACRFVRR